MAESKNVKEFPDVGNKLTAPFKKSVFERHKAEAEAKRQREEAETAAVYEDFVKSFDDDSNISSSRNGASAMRGGASGASSGGSVSAGFSKRHFSGPPGRGGLPKSGPGSLGPAAPSLSRKKEYDGAPPMKREGLFAYEDISSGPADPKKALQHSDDEDSDSQREAQERSVPKPTLRLSSLPPGISSAALKAIIPSNMIVEGLKILPSSIASGTDRQSASAVVTLAKDMAAVDIDTVVSALQNRYMGRGFYLSISRHLSTSANHLGPSYGLASASSSLPFNARPIPHPSFSRGPGTGPHRGGFAPPSSYNVAQGQFGRGRPQVQVTVTPPSDLKQLKLIHRTLEMLLTHGPEFEALLMSRKAVQNDEKWAWLWDSRSIGGVYYRWRLWDIMTGQLQRSRRLQGNRRFATGLAPQGQTIFDNGATWATPEHKLPYEYTTELSEIVEDSDYDSSADEDDSGDEGGRRRHHSGPHDPAQATRMDADGPSYLNPLQKAKLTHLLARLPTTHARLRRGDVARVTAFAIQHAGAGAEEVVSMLIANVHKPFAFTSANPTYQVSKQVPDNARNADTNLGMEEVDGDNTPAKLVGLYIISDILSTSSTSGVRHAWRYRSLFESFLRSHATFSHLGRLAQANNWGRLRAEKWKRSVMQLLSLWEGWCVFPGESQEFFVRTFENPPLTPAETAAAEAAKKAEDAAEIQKAKRDSKWRSVGDELPPSAAGASASPVPAETEMELDGDAMPFDDSEGGGAELEEDFDGEPMSVNEDEDLDGMPMSSSPSEDEAETLTTTNTNAQSHSSPRPQPPPTSEGSEPSTAVQDRRARLAASIAAKMGKASMPDSNGKSLSRGESKIDEAGQTAAAAAAGRKRQRPRAEDMFASDEDEGEG